MGGHPTTRLRWWDVKAIELVRKVSAVQARLRGSLRARGERAGAGGGAMVSAGRVVALRIVQATTIAARQMQSLPIPAPRPAERVVLSAAASQLRAMADMAELGGMSGDPQMAEMEGALGKLVAETLALVDKVLATDPELAPPRARPALPSSEEREGTNDPPQKVRF